ncbi:unnamed protein product [Brassicogethes aeneus]|uniref:Serine/threonine-protein kinase ATM n=1 Tax=Brassicogethes aeneus TaxID=1431903 RepID=A0A9P0BJP7_BRAAE|nr:unnamed protein product [Brassicogethes aeneus]
MSQQLDEQISLLESRRVTDRKKACEYLIGNINDPEIIQQLNNGGWNRLLTGVQHCLLKDADKLFDDMKKKGSDVCSCYISSDLYLAVLKYGLQEISLLTALKDFVLLPESNRSKVDGDHWKNLFDLLKSFYAEANVTSDLKQHYIKCLMLLFKFAPSCGYSPQSYRDEVLFINNLVENVKKSHHKVIQQDIVDIVTDFCKNIAKDGRITCCELGDHTFLNLFELYECNGREEELKVKLLDYFLLQMTMHHPNGESGNMAISSSAWKNYMIKMYSILIKEVEFYLKLSYKNTSYFIPSNKDIVNILDTFKMLFAELLNQNIDNTQILLRRLVLRKNIVDAEKLLQFFLISKYTSENGLRTIFALLPQISFSRPDTTKQESIINWLFNLYSTKFLCCKESVFIFGCLLFKQWPHEIYLEDSIEEKSNFTDITDVYYKINLNLDDTKEITDEKHCVENRVIDFEALYRFMLILRKNCAPKDIESTLHITEFLVNLIDFILDNNIRDECPTLVDLLQINMEKLEDFFSLANKNALLSNMVSHMDILYRIFSPKKNRNVSLLVRKLVSESLLKVIFDWNHFIQEEKSNGNASPQLVKIKESLMKTLSLYSFVSSKDEILENQTFVLDVLCDCDNIDVVLVVLEHLKYATPGLLTNAIAMNIVDDIQKLCEKKYRIYDYVVSVLDILKYFYPHMPHLNREIQEKGIGIMSTFYNNKDKYGPKVSYAILDCIESLYEYFKDILPKYGDIFQQFFIFVVNSLKNIIITNESLKMDCLEIVNFLVVENLTHLSDAISKLDTFPRTEEFEKLNTIIKNLKYNNKNVTLQKEIDFFLNANDDECNSSQEESLKQLRTTLIKEKVQLKNMYENLKNIRGFSEDCIQSHLHRLVAKLVKMTWGTDKSINSEAVKCLGELGPANLLTLILQPAQSLENDKCTPFEMISGIAVLLLSKYIVDCDIRISRVASNALHDVLNSKEAMKMTTASFSFSKKGSIDKRFLVPYIGSEILTNNSNVVLNQDLLISSINSDELWCPKNNITHELWVVELVRALLEAFGDDCFLPKLIPICNEKIEICEDLLPHLIFLCLHDKKIAKIMPTKINKFFKKQWLCSLNKSSSKDVIRDKRTVKCMLNVVDFVRLKKSVAKYKANKFDVSYLYVAQASQYCDDNFAALLYAELYCYSKLEEVEKKHYKPLPSGYTKHDLIYDSLDRETAKAMHNIFRKAYKAIGDLDAMNGCGISFILEPEFRVESYKDSNQWDQVAHFYEMQVGRGDISCKKMLMDSLKMCSLYEVPLLCASGIEEQQYECLWRLGHWNFEEPTSNAEVNLDVNDFEKFKFRYLKSLHDDDKLNFEKSSHLQNLCLVEKLKQTNLECSKNLYPILTQAQSLVEALDFAEAFDSGHFEGLLQKWHLQDLISKDSEFRYIEPIIAQRVVLLKSYLKIAKNKGLKEILVDMMLKFADLARNESDHRVASRILTDLQQMSKINDIQKAKIHLSQAQLCWALNDKLAAKHILSKLGRNEEENPIVRSRALKLSGQYMVETYSENRQTIIDDYFLKSLDIIDKTDTESTRQESDNIVDTYDKLASFADKEYQQMKSDIFQKKISNMEKSKETARLIRTKKSQTADERMAADLHEKQSKIDEDEIENNNKGRNNFLKLALRYYLKNLQRSDKNNIRIFRVMSLFLENRANASIKKIIVACMNKVPSYKYVDMLPQLVPHISEVNTDLFATEIFNIVKKCALEHPHHTLPLLLSLSNANEDRRFTKSKTNTFSNDDRVSSANNLLGKVKDTMNTDLVDKMDKVAKALIELAYYKAERKSDFSIPSSLKLTRIRSFDNVLLPTVTLPVSKSNNYENIVGIASFSTGFSNVGGVNTPKRIKCRGTDGIERSQLVKGLDDLRQDSVMQQVFTIMNSLLASSKQTTDLRIRTYKIMPLSMRSGILEWVENSMPIGNYLVGGPGLEGAHFRYKSKEELSPTECLYQYKNGVGESQEVRLAIFNTICKRSKPVFHKFFEEHFLQPTVWYERRRAYIHSIATTSMCGYILGIGDRHVSNILVDKNTAEVIHIDFGKSCEKTMEVLRTNAQTILTILEILLYDPLYFWSVTPAEANKRQTDDLDEHSDTDDSYEESGKELNITAERALLRLRSKLQGTEEGNQASIEHQVGTLIQKAMDPSNLCRLFYGWQPYL